MANGRGVADLVIHQGDDWAATVTVLNFDGTIPDLTGCTAVSQIRTGPADQAWVALADLLCDVLPPNQISLSLTNAQTTRFRQPSYYWDLKLVSPEGEVTTLLAGGVAVLFQVTRVYEPDEVIRELEVAADEALWVGIEERYER